VLFDDFLHDSKPEARALRLAGHVWIEHVAQEVALEAGAIVANDDFGESRALRFLEPRLDFDSAVLLALERLQANWLKRLLKI